MEQREMAEPSTPAPSQADADFAPEGRDFVPEGKPRPQGLLARLAYTLGGFGLLAATATDSLAVLGRHVGFHLLGSIELVQAAVVLLAASAMLIVTLAQGHASVHIVTERLSPGTARLLARIAALVSGIVFLLLVIGSAWVASELWSGFERTELLHIPLRWLRVVWIGFALLISAQFFRIALRRPS